METQTLMDLVMAGLGISAAPIIMLLVNVMKRFGLNSDDAPTAAAFVGMVLGLMVAFELGGTSVLSALVGIAAGINIGYAAVGIHTSNKKKKVDETGMAHID
jgi:hypothetical protein